MYPVEGHPGPIHGVVLASTGFQMTMSKVVHTTSGPVCDRTQSQAPPLCLPHPRSGDLGSGCPKPELVRSGSLCLLPDGPHSQGGQKTRQYNCMVILIALDWPGVPWFWDLVQLSLEILLKLPVFLMLHKQSDSQEFHKNPQYKNPHAWHLGVKNCKNKASLQKW